MTVKLLMLVVSFSIMLRVGFYSRRHATNVSNFVLGERGVDPWLAASAYDTSYLSAVVFISYAGQLRQKYGLASTWIGVGNALISNLLVWIILGRRTGVMNKYLSSATMPEFSGSRFHGRSMKIATSLIIPVFLIPYTVSVYDGLSRLFNMALDIPYSACVVGMAVLTAVYVILGGYIATAINDFIQGIIMLAGIAAIILSVLSGQGGLSAAVGRLAQIPSEVPVTLDQPGAYILFFGPDPLNLLGVVILTSLGTWGPPQMIHKFYIIRSKKAIATDTAVSAPFAVVISGGNYFLDGFDRLFGNPVIYNGDGSMAYDAIIPAMPSGLPDLPIGIIVILILSVSISTLSSLVLTSSSTLTLDFIKGCLVKNMKDRTQLVLMQCLVAVFTVLGVALALDPPDFIAQPMGISWNALAGTFLAPFLYGLHWKKTAPAAVWTSFATGIGITVSDMFLYYIASPIDVGAASIIVGFIIVPLVFLLTPGMDSRNTNAIFSYYDSLVEVTTKKVLPGDQSFDSSVFKKKKKK